MENGHYTSLSNEEYHQAEGVSKTSLDLFHSDENALAWAKECPVDEESLKTFDFGDACHAICLEPDRLKTDFVVLPEINLRTNQGKADKAAFIKVNEGKKILSHEEMAKLNLMFESVMAHPGARRLIEAEGEAEGSWFWTDEETDVKCRCRPDKNIANSRVLVDIKTTDLLKKFHFSVDDYRYYVQDPFYVDGLRANDQDKTSMVFLVIQKRIEIGRYPVMVKTLSPEVVEFGRQQYKKDLRAYAEFKQRNELKIVSELTMHRGFMNRVYGE